MSNPNRLEPRSPRMRWATLAVIAVLAVVVGACGDDSGGGSSSGSSGGSSSSGEPVSSEPIKWPVPGEVKCGGSETGDDPCKLPGTVPEGDEVEIGFFCLSNDSYITSVAETARKIAEDNNATLTEVLNPFNPAMQVRQMQDALTADKFDAYMFCPINTGALAPIAKQLDQRDIPWATWVFVFGDDNTTAKLQFEGKGLSVLEPPSVIGTYTGQAVVDACEGKDPCLVGKMRGAEILPFDQARSDGWDEVVNEHPNIEVVDTVFGNYNTIDGRKATQDLLSAHPDIDVLASFSDQMSIGAEEPIEAAGKTGDITIVSQGGSELGVTGVKEGRFYSTTPILAQNEGTAMAYYVLNRARGVDVPPLGINTFDTLGDVPAVMTKDNEKEWAGFEGQWTGS